MADDTTTDEPTEVIPETSATDAPTDELDTGGKKALDAERLARRDAEKRAKDLEKRVKAFEDADKSELEKAATRAEQAEQRAKSLIERTVKAEIRATASASFADPSDAAAFLDLSAYIDENGEIDGEQIKADLADLLKRKPHLSKTPGRSGPKPDLSQGSKPGGTPDFGAQIAEATAAGNHRLAIQLKRQQAALSKPPS